MFAELEDPAFVETEPFPDRVPALHHRVERADRRLIPAVQLPVHIHEKVSVALVKALKHGKILLLRRTRGSLRQRTDRRCEVPGFDETGGIAGALATGGRMAYGSCP